MVDNELVKLNQDVIKGYEENIVLPEVRRFNVLEDYDLMVKEFIKFHRLKGNAESGLKTYEYALNRFRKYLINANNFIDAYINMLEEDMRKGTSKPYIKLNTGIVRHFSKHFHLHYEEQLPIFRYELKNPEYVSIAFMTNENITINISGEQKEIGKFIPLFINGDAQLGITANFQIKGSLDEMDEIVKNIFFNIAKYHTEVY